jgi:hypothetical protein
MEPQDDNSEYQTMLEAGRQNAAYQADIEKQKALAARLRSAPELAGQMVSGHYIAPNALEVIGDVMNKRKAAAADAAHSKATAGLGDSMSAQNQMVLARILRSQQPVVPKPQPVQQNPYAITPAMTVDAMREGRSEY